MSDDQGSESRSAAPPRAAGSPKAEADRWFPVVYDCPRDLAEQWHRREPSGATLQPTSFVHEAYLRLAQGGPFACEDQAHFLFLAARAMRRVLVDRARRAAATKRGGGWRRVALGGLSASADASAVEILALNEALEKLAAGHDRAARVVETRFFGGLTTDDTARLLGISPRTAELDWRFARAWLMRELEPEGNR